MTTAKHVPSEILRKLVHIAFGFCALLLRWLTTGQAAAVAIAALIHNWLVLPRLFGRRIARSPRGTDRGIILYPIAVFILIVAFPEDRGLAAAGWAILAFGDGSATLAGKTVGGPKLPWSPDKTIVGSIAFVMVGGTAAWLTAAFVDPVPGYTLSWMTLAFAAAAAAAIAESLPLEVDDNLVVPLVAGLVLLALSRTSRGFEPRLDETALAWLGANAALAIAGFVARSVSLSGAIGGFILGAALIVFAGWQLYAVLLAFFVIGTAATKLGYRRKAAEGLAQEGEGRRGFSHAWSNVGVAAILSVCIAYEMGSAEALWLGAIAALATATADTTASEIGQLFGRRAFLPLTFRRVPRGTEGAISVEGTLAGAMAGVAVGALGVWLAPRAVPFAQGTAIVGFAAIAGSYLESLAGSWNRTRTRPVPNGALNFFNTLVGALLAILAWTIISKDLS